jgi:hypothetical protein
MHYDRYGRRGYTGELSRHRDPGPQRRAPVLHVLILGAALALVGALLGLW